MSLAPSNALTMPHTSSLKIDLFIYLYCLAEICLRLFAQNATTAEEGKQHILPKDELNFSALFLRIFSPRQMLRIRNGDDKEVLIECLLS